MFVLTRLPFWLTCVFWPRPYRSQATTLLSLLVVLHFSSCTNTINIGAVRCARLGIITVVTTIGNACSNSLACDMLVVCCDNNNSQYYFVLPVIRLIKLSAFHNYHVGFYNYHSQSFFVNAGLHNISTDKFVTNSYSSSISIAHSITHNIWLIFIMCFIIIMWTTAISMFAGVTSSMAIRRIRVRIFIGHD